MKNLAENFICRSKAVDDERWASARMRGAEIDAKAAAREGTLADQIIREWEEVAPPRPIIDRIIILRVVNPQLILTVDGMGPSGEGEVPKEILTSLAELITEAEDRSLGDILRDVVWGKDSPERPVETSTILDGDNGSSAYVRWDISDVTLEDAHSVLWTLLCVQAGTIPLEDVYSTSGCRRPMKTSKSMTDHAVDALCSVCDDDDDHQPQA